MNIERGAMDNLQKENNDEKKLTISIELKGDEVDRFERAYNAHSKDMVARRPARAAVARKLMLERIVELEAEQEAA